MTKRMTIKEVLEHSWIQKHNKSNISEMRRKSRDIHASIFKIYSTADD